MGTVQNERPGWGFNTEVLKVVLTANQQKSHLQTKKKTENKYVFVIAFLLYSRCAKSIWLCVAAKVG